MNNNNDIEKFTNMLNEEEQNNEMKNIDKTYNRSNVNFNVALSNPNLKVNDSMSINIKNNLNLTNYGTEPIDEQQSSQNYNHPNTNNNINNDENLINNYSSNNINLKQKEEMNNSNLHTNSTKSKKAINSDNGVEKNIFGELKFIILVFLIIFILVMFFPNISDYFRN